MAVPHNAYLVLPRLRVQNLNSISSPLTWGAPAITAAMGFMHALQRQIPKEKLFLLTKVGVVIHDFESQMNGDYVKKFNLTRNPVGKGGETLGIIEEGRAHATMSLVFGVFLGGNSTDSLQISELAQQISELAEKMRFAGGSIIPNPKNFRSAEIALIEESEEAEIKLADLKRSLLPGFALLSRDDLLISHTQELQQHTPEATALDAWLNLSRLNRHCIVSEKEVDGETKEIVEWKYDRESGSGWIVPIPVGYSALSELYQAGQVQNARDMTVPFRFVESMYSIGQWCSPHRLFSLDELLWSTSTDHQAGIYRCSNSNSMQQSN